jgi:hypothetical protein
MIDEQLLQIVEQVELLLRRIAVGVGARSRRRR